MSNYQKYLEILNKSSAHNQSQADSLAHNASLNHDTSMNQSFQQKHYQSLSHPPVAQQLAYERSLQKEQQLDGLIQRVDSLFLKFESQDDKISNIMKLVKLQQSQMETWEEEMGMVKRFIKQTQQAEATKQNSISGNSFYEIEQTVRSICENQMRDMQQKLDKLGEEIAYDINKLETQVQNTHRKTNSFNSLIIHSGKENSHSTRFDNPDELLRQLAKFLEGKIPSIEQQHIIQQKNRDLAKSLQGQKQQMVKIVNSMEKINNKVNNQQKAIEKIRKSNSVTRSASRSKTFENDKTINRNINDLRTDVKNSYQYLCTNIKEIKDKQSVTVECITQIQKQLLLRGIGRNIDSLDEQIKLVKVAKPNRLTKFFKQHSDFEEDSSVNVSHRNSHLPSEISADKGYSTLKNIKEQVERSNSQTSKHYQSQSAYRKYKQANQVLNTNTSMSNPRMLTQEKSKRKRSKSPISSKSNVSRRDFSQERIRRLSRSKSQQKSNKRPFR